LPAFVDFIGFFLQFAFVSFRVQRVFSAFSATFRATFSLFPRLFMRFGEVRIAAFVAQKPVRFVDLAVPNQRVTNGPPLPGADAQNPGHEPGVVRDRLTPVMDEVDDDGVGPALFQRQAHCSEHEVRAEPLVPRAGAQPRVLRSWNRRTDRIADE